MAIFSALTAIYSGAAAFIIPAIISYIFFVALLSLVNNHAEFFTGAGVGLAAVVAVPLWGANLVLALEEIAAIVDVSGIVELIFGILSMVL